MQMSGAAAANERILHPRKPSDPYKAKGSATHVVCCKSIIYAWYSILRLPSIVLSDFRRAKALPPAETYIPGGVLAVREFIQGALSPAVAAASGTAPTPARMLGFAVRSVYNDVQIYF
jgi:hypothetical protein